MRIFDKEYDIAIVLEENTDEAIYLAAKDLQNNLRRLSGKKGGNIQITIANTIFPRSFILTP